MTQNNKENEINREKLIENKILKEKIYFNNLSSKIKCYIIPKEEYIEKTAIIAVNYGSINNIFETKNEKIITPDGVAHFLEHKMFEDEKVNIFEEFTKLKADVNAFTNYNYTAYYFNSIDNFEKNLENLFNLVFNTYFTEENIEKEKSIIEQEIKMYQDNPNFKVYFNMQKEMYKNIGINKDIAGTVDSIKKIDKNILTKCYETFYQKENMVVVCAGNLKRENIYEIINKKIQENHKTHIPFKKIILKEDEKVNKKYIEENMIISKPIFSLGFKDNNRTKNKEELLVATKILLDIICGESSDLYEKLYNKSLINSDFYTDYTFGQNYGTSIFSGFSHNPKKVKEEILKEIKKYKKEGIKKEIFEQIRKKHIGRYIRIFDSIETICNLQVDFLLKNIDIFNIIDTFNNITIDTLIERLKEHFTEENYVLSVIKNKK